MIYMQGVHCKKQMYEDWLKDRARSTYFVRSREKRTCPLPENIWSEVHRLSAVEREQIDAYPVMDNKILG